MTTAGIIAGAVIFCLGLFAALVDRTNQRDDALDALAKSEAECVELARVAKTAAAQAAELDQENMRLHLELSEVQLLAGHTPPALTLVRDDDAVWADMLAARPKPFGDVS